VAIIKKHGSGILKITNVRVLWTRTGDTHYIINASRFNILPPVRIAETIEDNVETLVMQIEFTSGMPKVYLRFTGDEAKNRAERVKNVLD
jgi:hypothetical protein